MSYLSLNNIRKTFGETVALSDVNLQVEEGELVCLLGPSGCGKTTLLRIIAGFLEATDGELLLSGESIGHLPPHKRDFGMVFQSLALFPHMSVADNIAYGMKVKKIDKAKRKARVAELLEMVQLPHVANRPVSALSGGQQQRVAIARALAIPPKVFLLDEPLSALDAQIRENMQIELRQLQQNLGVTTIIVTHDQHEAMMLADKLVILKDGIVQQAGAPSEIYQRPSNPFVAQFLGAANDLPVIVQNGSHVTICGQTLAITTEHAANTELTLTVRSEDIQINIDDSAASSTGSHTLKGNASFVRDLGAKTELLVQIDDQTIRCHGADSTYRSVKEGDTVHISFANDKFLLFPKEN